MKRFFINSLIVITTFILISNSAFAGSFKKNYLNTQPGGNQINVDMLKSQVGLFKEALDEFGAVSPLQAARLWAEGEKSRNGVFQYSVASKELKNKLLKSLGKAEVNLWVIGVSSPWVVKWEIIENKKLSTLKYEIKIKYYWATSNGEEKPTITTLIIEKQRGYWRATKAS